MINLMPTLKPSLSRLIYHSLLDVTLSYVAYRFRHWIQQGEFKLVEDEGNKHMQFHNGIPPDDTINNKWFIFFFMCSFSLRNISRSKLVTLKCSSLHKPAWIACVLVFWWYIAWCLAASLPRVLLNTGKTVI